MDSQDIRTIARHQHRRGVTLVELDDGQHRVCIDIGAGDVLALTAHATSAVQAPVASPSADAGAIVVKADGLGLFRRAHPSRPGEPVVCAGAAVTEGRPLALLQLGDVFTSIHAPVGGVVERVFAEEGQRVDHGMPLFMLRPAGR